MDKISIRRAVGERMDSLPVLDAHTHLIGGRLGARGLHDVLLYHMSVSDLYAAGCPSGARLSQYPLIPSDEEAISRLKEAIPFVKHVRNTSIHWLVRVILKDLYGVEEEIDETNWMRAHHLIRERAHDRAWHLEVMKRANIKRFCTEIARREGGVDDDILQYSIEWAFPARCQWGEYDTALYEMECCWGKLPESPTPIGAGKRPATEKAIRSVDDAREAVNWYVDHIPRDIVISSAMHISTDIDYRLVTDAEMVEALEHRETAGPEERDIYASYINELVLAAWEEKLGDKVVFQFSFAAEPLPYETSSRVSQRTIAQVADMISRHPKMRFQCMLSSRHANQSLCTLCRELPNLSLAGYWWHNFFPSTIRQVIDERLDMLPANKQVGFFSDAYCVEWAYAKVFLVKQILADALTDKIASGQYGIDMAVEIARQMLFETPQTLLRMVPVNE